ncbi:hypothetical protein BDZ85DRAFT_27614 [Elsinoe ampelina]|uniref:Uncharacterized protein n=1 Tax=Elsinoe ampelina TaxID=302913 RepID=A0A6A6G459_9PEZI|nr:hypothetical protein BDZ85DRAFT_27614 [Elsinoe ampelina]
MTLQLDTRKMRISRFSGPDTISVAPMKHDKRVPARGCFRHPATRRETRHQRRRGCRTFSKTKQRTQRIKSSIKIQPQPEENDRTTPSKPPTSSTPSTPANPNHPPATMHFPTLATAALGLLAITPASAKCLNGPKRAGDVCLGTNEGNTVCGPGGDGNIVRAKVRGVGTLADIS